MKTLGYPNRGKWVENETTTPFYICCMLHYTYPKLLIVLIVYTFMIECSKCTNVKGYVWLALYSETFLSYYSLDFVYLKETFQLSYNSLHQ